MAPEHKFLQWRSHESAPIKVDDYQLRLESKALTVRWEDGGLVWNRPTAVHVVRAGEIQRLPIVDITRRVQVILWGLAALFGLLALWSELAAVKQARTHLKGSVSDE